MPNQLINFTNQWSFCNISNSTAKHAKTEMFTIAKQIAAAEKSMMAFVAAGVFYYIFNLLVALIMEKIEKKLSYYK